MVFQAAKKAESSSVIGSDFKDLEMVKLAEKKAMLDIENANKTAEKIIIKAEQDINIHQQNTIANLKKALDIEYQAEEKIAIAQSKKIREEGEIEAQKLKEKTRIRTPKAIDYIVNAIIHE